jgi:hypothetical protein
MLLLTEPFGHGTGDHISLRGRPDWAKLEPILDGYGCYPPAKPKIKACLHHAGRYDCVVQSIWFRAQHSELKKALAAIGVELLIYELAPMHKNKLR